MSTDSQNKPQRKTGLGRGLSALLGETDNPTTATEREHDVQEVPIEFLVPNPDQPRRNFDEDELSALADSIQQKGIIQPILVRQSPDDPTMFQIVAGERRWRAAQQARIHSVPIIRKELSDAEVLELAIIENVQRADLNAIEEAGGYARLVEHFSYTQENLAKIIGKSRSHIANMMRLLTLKKSVQELVEQGHLTAGHARALISHDDQEALAWEIVKRNLSVREAERLVKDGRSPAKAQKSSKSAAKDPDTRALEGDLSAALGLPVAITHKNPEGEIRLKYGTLDQLDEICRRLCQTPQAVGDD